MTERRGLAARLGALGAIAYIPLLFTAHGKVAADTKAYLYLDPSKLLSRAAYLWDQHVAFGTVTHQNIGYLWPMGPWYWLFDELGAPDWLAQRLWVGTLLFLAGAGILYLGRTIGPRAPLAWTAGAFVYLLTPYVLNYVARLSILLLPWVALPWLVALAHRAVVTGRWRYPALFALVVATAGSVNATALVLVGLGPLLWIIFGVVVHGETSWRRALVTSLRIGVLSLLTNAWWIAGLAVQGGYGLDVLRYTETVQTVARAALSSEILRGLGYWFFYGTDKLGPWTEPGRTFTENLWLLGLGFVLPVAALVAAWMIRWRYRAFAVALVVLGTAIAVGAFPYSSPSPIGAVFKRSAASSTAAMALRSTGRVIPLVVLGLVLLLVGGLVALVRWRPRAGAIAAGVVILLALLGNPSLWTGGFVAENLQHPDDVPAYWKDAAAYLDSRGQSTRVLELPGADFATYRWGNYIEPVTPGLMDRPMVARELVPYGTEASADLLIALDRRLQEGVLDPSALVPVARLMGVGDVLARNDLQYERFRLARPEQLRRVLDAVPAGLGPLKGFGASTTNASSPRLPMHDEIYLQSRDVSENPPVVVRGIQDPLPIVRGRSSSGATLLEGDGEGVVEAAAAGLLGGDGVLLSTPALAGRPDVLRRALRAGGRVVVTDTNRKRARRWGTVRDNDSYTERADEKPLVVDPSDSPLPLFPDAPVSMFTTVEQRGVRRVDATRYGNHVTYTPADRPDRALDGDSRTAWITGGLGPTAGSRLEVEAKGPVTTDHVDLVQSAQGRRKITLVRVLLDGKKVADARLDDSSFGAAGQRVSFGTARTFTTFALEIVGDNVGQVPNYGKYNGVGFSEVRLAGLHVDDVVRLPSSLLSKGGDNPLTILLSRLRADPQEPFARDEEQAMVRSFRLPAARTLRLTGLARLNERVPDEKIDEVLGGEPFASSGHLAGDAPARAAAAFDGDPTTAWVGHFGDQTGQWLEVRRPIPVTVDQLQPTFLDDADHSVPTRVTITNESGERRQVVLSDGPTTFPAISGRTLRFTFDRVRPTLTTDWFSQAPIAMPISIVDLGAPSLQAPLPDGSLSVCRDDLLTVDGRPVPLAVRGDGADALAPLDVRTCDGAPLELGAGDHLLRTADGSVGGLDLDRLVLSTDAAPASSLPTGTGGVTVLRSGPVSMDVRVSGGAARWLVLGQSNSAGWHATVAGRDLGKPVLVDGYANGWLVDPGQDGVVVHLRWTPQRIVWAGIGISGVGVLLCLGLLLLGLRRRPAELTPTYAADPAVRISPWVAGPALSSGRAVVVALLLGIATALVVNPAVGVLLLPAAYAALRHRYGRAVGPAAALLLAFAGVVTVAREWQFHYPVDFSWSDFFHPAHYVAWYALALLVTLLVVDRLRRR